MHTLDNASTAAADFANPANWQGVDDEPTAGSDNLVKSGGVDASINYNYLNKWGLFNADTDFWVNSSYYATDLGTSYIFPVKKDDIITIYKGSKNGRCYLLKSYPVYDNIIDMEGSLIPVDQESISITIPAGVKYIYISKVYGGYDNYSPKRVLLNGLDVQYNIIQDVNAIKDNEKINTKIIQGNTFGLIDVWLTSSGESSDDQGNGYLYKVEEGDNVYIKAGSNFVRAAFCSNNSYPLSLVGSLVQVSADSEQTLTAPNGAKYIYVSNIYFSGTVDYSPKELLINSKVPDCGLMFGKKIYIDYDATNHRFEVFVRVGETDMFYSYIIGLRNNTSEIVYQYVWGLMGGYYCQYKNNTFRKLFKTIYEAENEFAFRYSGRADYTGGFHGDERIDIASGTYVKFLINGAPLVNSQLESSFSVWADSFSYIENSSLHATTADGTTPIEGHPIIAYHYKETIVGKKINVTNIVRFVTDLSIQQYFSGLFCIKKSLATTTDVSGEVIDTSQGTGTLITVSDESATKALFWNSDNNVGASVESDVKRQNFTQVWEPVMKIDDRTSAFYDTKYYRYIGVFDVVNGNILETEMNVEFL